MLELQYGILLLASLSVTYLAINSNTNKKRMVNSLISVLLHSAGALGALSVTVVETVENDAGNLVIDTYAYADTTLVALHVVLVAVSILFVVTGAYSNVEKDVKLES